jgi:hypothetical protein
VPPVCVFLVAIVFLRATGSKAWVHRPLPTCRRAKPEGTGKRIVPMHTIALRSAACAIG